jgi:hypothetical protein
MEAFKRGLYDLRHELDPGHWQTAYTFVAVREGPLLRKRCLLAFLSPVTTLFLTVVAVFSVTYACARRSPICSISNGSITATFSIFIVGP